MNSLEEKKPTAGTLFDVTFILAVYYVSAVVSSTVSAPCKSSLLFFFGCERKNAKGIQGFITAN